MTRGATRRCTGLRRAATRPSLRCYCPKRSVWCWMAELAGSATQTPSTPACSCQNRGPFLGQKGQPPTHHRVQFGLLCAARAGFEKLDHQVQGLSKCCPRPGECGVAEHGEPGPSAGDGGGPRCGKRAQRPGRFPGRIAAERAARQPQNREPTTRWCAALMGLRRS